MKGVTIMAHYTITIQTLINNNFDFQLDKYPIFDENYRETLNNKILNHYFDAEIGFETAPLFRHYLLAKLNEIMPLYNIMYEKQKDLLENIFGNVNLTETFQGENSNNSNVENNSQSNSTGNSNMKNLFQDTPQGELDTTSINNQKWATNLSLNENSTNGNITDNSTSVGNSNGTNNYIKKIVGNNGGKYNIELLKEIQNSIINIDIMIINELQDLFMGIY
jgi:hypothetical protein